MANVWEALGATAAVVGVIIVLLRISFQLGSLVSEFRAYRISNDKIVDVLRADVQLLKARRR